MPAPPKDSRSCLAEVLEVERVGDDGVIVSVRPELPMLDVRASRFFMLRHEDPRSPAIPRPFSLYRQRGTELDFLIKVMGRGTQALAQSRPGEKLRLIGPLGNGWPALDGDGPPWVLLAGGVGSAPFYLAIEQALKGMDGKTRCKKDQVTYLFGAARKGLLYDVDAFRGFGVNVFTATDDGSDGFKGNVLQLLDTLWTSGKVSRECRLLACGPERMLEGVEKLAREKQLECWLSLETLMGCGVGICNGCPVPTRPDGPLGKWPNAKCCVEGPVFSTREISLAHY
ncbi:MAG: dihydroorotate dehydrogenase electron transfer subunit [Planctomycetes bacterium]|nr:dihydroorotate dehydrogenase electron transfer subunit [Planctomycetota bacterium]